jgi:hypothetical protein
MALRPPGRLAVQGSQRGRDRISSIGLAAPPPGLPVRPDDLCYPDALRSKVTGQPGP